jgi:distribution and morphology protein 31
VPQIYEALANHVTSQQANGARLRNVSSWSLRVAAQGLLQLASTIRDGFTRTPTTHTGMLTQKSY